MNQSTNRIIESIHVIFDINSHKDEIDHAITIVKAWSNINLVYENAEIIMDEKCPAPQNKSSY